jgi:hypothetical protein
MVIKVNFFESHLQAASGTCAGPLAFNAEFLIIIGCCILGLLWAFYNMILVNKINVAKG